MVLRATQALLAQGEFQDLARIHSTFDGGSLASRARLATGLQTYVRLTVEQIFAGASAATLFDEKRRNAKAAIVPTMVLDLPAISFVEAYRAATWQVLLLSAYVSWSDAFKCDVDPIFSERETKEGKPVDLTFLCRHAFQYLVKAALTSNLLRAFPALGAFEESYRHLLLLAGPDPFAADGPEAGQRSIEIKDLISWCLATTSTFGVFRWVPLITDTSYYGRAFRRLAQFREEAAGMAAMNLRDPAGLAAAGKSLCWLARRLIQFLDHEWGMGPSSEEDVDPGGSITMLQMPGGFMLDALAGATRLEDLASDAYCIYREIYGIPVMIEIVPPNSQATRAHEYPAWQQKVEPYVSRTISELSRLAQWIRVPRLRSVENSGFLDPTNLYRLEADGRVFEDLVQKLDPRHQVDLIWMIDNSPSVSEAKIKMLCPAIVYQAEVARRAPAGLIRGVYCYAQHSLGRDRVSIRPLHTGDCAQLPKGELLHFDCRGPNRDALALAHICQTHFPRSSQGSGAQSGHIIAVVFGDAWPVAKGAGESAEVQTRRIVDCLRRDYPNLILLWLGVDSRYEVSLLNEHSISLRSTDGLQRLAQEFERVLRRAIAQHQHH